MIDLTREEALELLKVMARFEGFLLGLKDHETSAIQGELEYPVELLSRKLSND